MSKAGRWSRRLGRLDLQAKSPQAALNCARAQRVGGLTQMAVALLLAGMMSGVADLTGLALWLCSLFLVAFYRIASARSLLAQPDRDAIGQWQRNNLINFLLTGIVWAGLIWIPRTEASVLVVTAMFLIPAGICAAASHSLGPMPLGLCALVYPISLSQAAATLVLFQGPGAALLAIANLIYVVVMTFGVLMINRTLLSEWRLARINRGIATRSRAQAAALHAAQRQLMAANRQLEILAGQDALTDLANRRTWEERLRQQENLLRRYGGRAAIILVDLDYFKRINDQFGHPVGDAVLTRVGRVLRRELRANDMAARLGGEEFALLVVNAGMEEAEALAKRIRLRLAALRMAAADGTPIHVTASFGVAAWATPEEPAARVVERADQALYGAKDEGRDVIRLAVGQ